MEGRGGELMLLMRDQRGFVLSGIALLLVLPAMLLAASLLTIAGTRGGAVSLQTLSDKVDYTGYDIERVLNYMVNNELPTDSSSLSALAENYRAATGLLVDIGLQLDDVIIYVRDSRSAARYSSLLQLG